MTDEATASEISAPGKPAPAGEPEELFELAEPNLRALLATCGLDVEYVRAEGNTIYRKGADGREVPVLDYAGGYGSLVLGHNHPKILDRARKLLDEQTPVHAQFSFHPYANRLATELNRIIHRETGTTEPYYATFANSGAEAVEAAVKHAELDRVLRFAEAADKVSAAAGQVRTAVREHNATLPDALFARLGVDRPAGAAEAVEAALAAIERHNEKLRARPPVLLALEGGFHGKLLGSVQLTHNPDYREPFASLGVRTRFVPPDRPDVLKEILGERRALLHPVIEDGVVHLAERACPAFCAFLLEPVQGEGGIRPLPPEAARDIQDFGRAADCPLIIDEIQSGMGRTGALLASSWVGVRGDYYVLAKSLGGGIAKAAVMLVRQARYRPQFEFLHSSTFAKDSFSCHIALTVLELLEADGGLAYRQAAERGDALKAALERVRAAHPNVVKDVRGRGLMLGFEFHDQSDSTDRVFRDAALGGLFGYVLSGHLLHAHRIRTFPTASATHTLRFEPSVHLTDEEIGRLERGLADICVILRDQASGQLVTAS